MFVVDDDASIREALSSLVRSVGLSVETFSSAKEFLRHKRSEAPACLVLDVRLPGLSGMEFSANWPGRQSNSDHFHHRTWRHSNERARNEGRRG